MPLLAPERQAELFGRSTNARARAAHVDVDRVAQAEVVLEDLGASRCPRRDPHVTRSSRTSAPACSIFVSTRHTACLPPRFRRLTSACEAVESQILILNVIFNVSP